MKRLSGDIVNRSISKAYVCSTLQEVQVKAQKAGQKVPCSSWPLVTASTAIFRQAKTIVKATPVAALKNQV